MKPRNNLLLVVFFFTVTLICAQANAQVQRDTVSQPNKMKMQRDTARKSMTPRHPIDSVYRKQQRPNSQPIDTPPHGMMTASAVVFNQAQQPAQTQQPASGSKQLSESDKKFLMDAIAANNDEILMAKLAEEKSGSDHVKNVAKTIETDHEQLLDDLKNLAKSKAVSVSTIDTSHAMMEQKMLLGGKPGDFDNAWIKTMLGDHTVTLNKLEAASNTVSDPDLKNAIQKTIPIVKNHIDLLNKLK